MAAFELLPPSLSDEQRRHDETMVLDTNQQQSHVHVEHLTSHATNGTSIASSTFGYENSTLCPPPSTLNRQESSGYLSDGPNIPGSFALSRPSKAPSQVSPQAHPQSTAPLTLPYNSQQTTPMLIVTPPGAQGGSGSLILKGFGGSKMGRSRRLSHAMEDAEKSLKKKGIGKPTNQLRELELEQLKAVNQDQAMKIQQQGEQMQEGLKYIRERENDIKTLNEAVTQRAQELEVLKREIGLMRIEREQELTTTAAHNAEFLALRQKFEETEDLVKQLFNRNVDTMNDAAKAKEAAAAAEKRMQEAEKRANEAMMELGEERKETAVRIAEAYREREMSQSQKDLDAGEEKSINNMLIDREIVAVASNAEWGGTLSNGGDVDVDMANLRQITQQPEGTASTRSRVHDQLPKPITSKRQKYVPPPAVPSKRQRTTNTYDLSKLSEGGKLDLLLQTLLESRPGKNQHAVGKLFKKPIESVPKPEGRNDRNKWVRIQMNKMLRIEKDADILRYSDEIYADNTELQRKMSVYELTGSRGEGPVLAPMRIDWKNIKGRWNNKIYDLFKEYAEEEGYGVEDGEMDEDEEMELREIFFSRLKRLQAVINENRPRAKETFEESQRRVEARRDEVGAAKRRNARRECLYKARVTTILAKSPDPEVPISELTHEKKAWLDALLMHEELSLAGQSSDDSLPGSDIHFVREMDWRSSEIASRYDMVKAAMAKGYTEHGKRRSGNKPRERMRRKDHGQTSRRVPAGLPINFYDPVWYTGLNWRQKRDLEAKEEMVFLTHVNDTFQT